jgi:hypothetical protein
VVVLDDEMGEFVERGLPILSAAILDEVILPGRLGVVARDRSPRVGVKSNLSEVDPLGLGYPSRKGDHGTPPPNRGGVFIGWNY